MLKPIKYRDMLLNVNTPHTDIKWRLCVQNRSWWIWCRYTNQALSGKNWERQCKAIERTAAIQTEIWTRKFQNTKHEHYCAPQINMPRRKTRKVGQSPPLYYWCSSHHHHSCHVVCSQRRWCQHYYSATLDNPAVSSMTMWQHHSDGRHCVIHHLHCATANCSKTHC